MTPRCAGSTSCSRPPPTAESWRSVDLALDGETFTGTAPVAPGTTEVDYFVQVVDSGGNVSVSADKGANFVATPT